MRRRTVEKMLVDTSPPPPPAGLAERIKAEIPERLELSAELDGPRRAAPPRRTTWTMAAAAAVLLGLTAAVTWQLRSSGPDPRLLEQVGTPASAQEGHTTAESPRPEPTRREPEPSASSRHLESDAATAAPGAAGTPEQAAPERVQSGSEERARPPREGAAAGRTDVREQPHAAQKLEGSARQLAELEAPGKDKEATRLRSVLGNTSGQHGARRMPIPDPVPGDPEPPRLQHEEKLVLGMPAGVVEPPPPPVPPAPGEQYKQVTAAPRPPAPRDAVITAPHAPPSTGGTAEPNDQPYGDVFFRGYGVNPFIDTEDDHLSTFGLDVDTGSYTVIRRYLRDGHLPPPEAVRVEEVVNALHYGDEPPRRGDFALTAEGAPTPFAEGERYVTLRFAVTARQVAAAQRPAAILTFVVDTSGSMGRENRLGLVRAALDELLGQLRPDDRVGLVVYGSRGQVLLDPTGDHEAMRAAIERLRPSGSTNAEEGLVLGYELADRHFEEGAINRVILCSDGVANVGRTGPESILARIAAYADRGIELTTVGFGMGNYNDALMERLADTGDGRYAYVDALPEARRIFAEELTGTLLTVARDARAQVDFNPETVARYRLLGYENRDIADERFRDPTVDAGEVGAGHTVTALYEVKLQPGVRRRSRALLATLSLRWRPAAGGAEQEIQRSLAFRDLAPSWEAATPALRLASLAAEFAEILRGAYWARGGDMGEVLRRAQELAPAFAGDPRMADFVGLAAAAAELRPPTPAARRK